MQTRNRKGFIGAEANDKITYTKQQNITATGREANLPQNVKNGRFHFLFFKFVLPHPNLPQYI